MARAPNVLASLEGLSEKAAADHVPYDLWHSQGHLQASPGRTVSYEFVAHHLRHLFQRYQIQKIGFDRWNMKHLRPWLLRAGFHEQMIEEHFVEFGQGVASMSPALRDLEQVLLEGELAHGGHPVLAMCVANTVIALDDAGNRKPCKRKSTGRIDGLIGARDGHRGSTVASYPDRRHRYDRLTKKDPAETGGAEKSGTKGATPFSTASLTMQVTSRSSPHVLGCRAVTTKSNAPGVAFA